MNRISSCPRCAVTDGFVRSGAFVKCQQCNCIFCAFTGRERHEPRLNKFAFLQDSVRELERNYGEERVAQCPGCGFPQVNEGETALAETTCKHCSLPWCFQCSAPMEPILAHGAAWHRPTCSLFAESETGAVEEIRECLMCGKEGKRCGKPKALATPRRFALDEK